MLRYAPRETSPPELVTPEEDDLLRKAFGRYGGSFAARLDAIRVVARYQQHGSGKWLLCDCRPGAERPPALIPVAMTHIRRHEDARWPVHAETCKFFREPEEQLVLTASYLRSRSRPFRPVRRFTMWVEQMAGPFTACSQASRRPGLAQLRSLQSWLARKKNVLLSIEKPLFDVGPDTGPDVQPRPPCIPDFVVGSGAVTAIVETMAVADVHYRRRKMRVHAALSAALAEAPVVMHDFHEPPGRAQAWRDSRFWREMRWTLTGPETRSEAAQASPLPVPSPLAARRQGAGTATPGPA